MGVFSVFRTGFPQKGNAEGFGKTGGGKSSDQGKPRNGSDQRAHCPGDRKDPLDLDAHDLSRIDVLLSCAHRDAQF